MTSTTPQSFVTNLEDDGSDVFDLDTVCSDAELEEQLPDVSNQIPRIPPMPMNAAAFPFPIPNVAILDLDSIVIPDRRVGRKKQTRSTWSERFKELKEYSEQHGHCRVKVNDGTLGTWCKNQRYQYRLLVQKKNSELTVEKIELLNSIGFVWSAKPLNQWRSKFEELIEFKRKHGHTNVPCRQGSLGVWVKNQRSQYRLLVTNKHSELNQWRVNALNSVGFEWSRNRGGQKKDNRY